MPLGVELVQELIGTAVLIALGDGAVATAVLARSKGLGAGWLSIQLGWGIAVFAGVSVAYDSGANLNPAVTIALLVAGRFPQGVGVAALYVVVQIVGAFIGAVLVWVAFKKHYDAEEDPVTILSTFSTTPAIRALPWNFATEVVATGVFAFVVIAFGKGSTPAGLGALPVAVLVAGIGIGLGGPTGWAINPARDIGPRVAHALLPIPHKGDGQWSYAWVPLAGPITGGVVAALLSYALLPLLHH